MTAITTTAPFANNPSPVPLTPAGGNANTGNSVFGTVLDTINPLQHIPVVSSLFRAAQGISISPVAQIAGDTLFGGLIGGAISSFLSSAADVGVKQASGKSISEHVVDTLDASPTATPLAPASPTETAADVTDAKKEEISAKVDAALVTLLHQNGQARHVAAQYKRAQVHDSTDVILDSLKFQASGKI